MYYPQKKKMFSWYIVLATWFYSGKFKFAPGTVGSLAAYPLYYLMISGSFDIQEAQLSLYFAVVVLFFLGLLAIDKFHKETYLIDDKSIVIDEVIGQLLTIALSLPSLKYLGVNLLHIQSEFTLINFVFLASFILFRLFDIKKPFFIAIIDRRMKNALGVILDDICAGLLSAGVIVVLAYVIRLYKSHIYF